MGSYMSRPKTEKISEDGGRLSTEVSRFGVSSMQGWRQTMEDAHVACTDFRDGNASVYGVFDGHGGHAVSAWVSRYFMATLEEELTEVQKNGPIEADDNSGVELIKKSLTRSFLVMDEKMRRDDIRKDISDLHDKLLPKQGEDCDEKVNSEDPDASLMRYLVEYSEEAKRKGKLPKGIVFKVSDSAGKEHDVSIDGDALVVDGVGNDQEDSDEEEDEKRPIESSKQIGDTCTNSKQPESDSFSSRKKSQPKKRAKAESGIASNTEHGGSPLCSPKRKGILGNKEEPDEQQLPAADGSKTENDDEASSAEKEKSMVESDTGLADNCNAENALLQNGAPEGCGATAVVAYISNGNPRRIYVANAGDSRCVLSRAGKAFEMSRDHKPTLEDEDMRIRKAGGCVIRGRVDGNLNLSRALGDLYYKRDNHLTPEEQRITANPEIQVMELTDEDEFAILACDGIWDCLSSQDCVDYVRLKLFACDDTTEEPVLSRICEDLCDHCLAEDIVQSEGIGCDNMTAMICQLAPLSKIKTHNRPPDEVPKAGVIKSAGDEDNSEEDE